MKYCADCVDMNTTPNKSGLFKCVNSRSGYDFVSARQIGCSYLTECFNSRRSERERENLMSISRQKGFYIVTSVVNTLNIEDSQVYLDTFDYFRNEIMPRLNGGEEWVSDYDTYGPIVAKKVEGDKDKCLSLFDNYIKPFTGLIINNEVDSAVTIYQSMYSSLKDEYRVTSEKKLKER